MALVTRLATASLDVSTARNAPQITGLHAGEDLDACAPCYIKSSDGEVYMCDGTADNEAAEFAGFTPRAASENEPVTLFGLGTRMRYGSSLTPGDIYYIGATAGRIDTDQQVGDRIGVAMAVTDTDIVVIRSHPNYPSGAIDTGDIADDAITDAKVDWGTGSGQVSAADVPIADAGSLITATEVEAALQELAAKDPGHTFTGDVTGTGDHTNLGAASVALTIAADAVTAAKAHVFLSTEQTGNGSAQNVAHGLGVTPTVVLVIPSDMPDSAWSLVQGTHTDTNVVVTATSGGKYYVLAWA